LTGCFYVVSAAREWKQGDEKCVSLSRRFRGLRAGVRPSAVNQIAEGSLISALGPALGGSASKTTAWSQ
jgi:hypothetical protein